MKIPWNDLKNKPVIVKITQLHILAQPKTLADFDYADLLEDAFAKKLQRLASRELLLDSTKQPADSNGSFFSSIIAKIIDNIQFNVSDIHVRVQDPQIDNNVLAVQSSTSWLTLSLPASLELLWSPCL